MTDRPLWRQILNRDPLGQRKPRADVTGDVQTQRVVTLEQGRSPSGDYLLRPWLQAYAQPQQWLDTRTLPGPECLRPGDAVVIVRYLPLPWKRLIQSIRPTLGSLTFFMDDDLFDPRALEELPFDYAQKVERLALTHRSWLRQQAAALWVSTPHLAQKYADWSPVLLPMAPPQALLSQRRMVRVAYHGTASHQAELVWLQPVLANVQARCPDTQVELFGDHAVYRRYRLMPRIAVLHPMSWENYLTYTAGQGCDIGLAPLQPGRFNAGRGPTKFFDYTRAGAVGVYADVPPYRDFVRHGVDGLLLPDDVQVWSDAIVALAGDPSRRQAMAEAARQRLAG